MLQNIYFVVIDALLAAFWKSFHACICLGNFRSLIRITLINDQWIARDDLHFVGSGVNHDLLGFVVRRSPLQLSVAGHAWCGMAL